MLLRAVGGCAAWPFVWACAVFVLEEAGWLVGAPTAGEARELGFALGTGAATLGPPTAVPLVDVNGIVNFDRWFEDCRMLREIFTLVKVEGGLSWNMVAVLHTTLGSRVQVETIASQCIPRWRPESKRMSILLVCPNISKRELLLACRVGGPD